MTLIHPIRLDNAPTALEYSTTTPQSPLWRCDCTHKPPDPTNSSTSLALLGLDQAHRDLDLWLHPMHDSPWRITSLMALTAFWETPSSISFSSSFVEPTTSPCHQFAPPSEKMESQAQFFLRERIPVYHDSEWRRGRLTVKRAVRLSTTNKVTWVGVQDSKKKKKESRAGKKLIFFYSVHMGILRTLN